MVDIPSQAVSWSGTPRAATPQYIQAAINAGANGTTYRLGWGHHRGQAVTLKSNDKLILQAGAILTGAEDVGTHSWTNNGNGTWTKNIVTGQRTTTNIMGTASGYDNTRGEKIILDGDMMAYRTTVGQVDEYHAYANGSTITIGRNPAALSLIEVIRTLGITGGNEIGGETTAERNQIYGYVGYELGHGGGQRGAIRVSTNGLIHDVEIYAMAVAGLAMGPGSTGRNVTVRHCGQVGVGADGALQYHVDGINFLEGCWVYGNGISGWNNGWEGGNSKWAWTENLTVRGTLWDATPDPRYVRFGNTPTSAMWFDISNDGYRVSSSVFRGYPGVDWRGGIFLEISYSGKIWNNIFYNSGKGEQGSAFWQGGCVSDHSGAFPGTTIDATVDVHDNLFYKTAGGWMIISSGAHDGDTGWYGAYRDQYHDVKRNTVYLMNDSSFSPETVGIRDGAATYKPRYNDFDDNIYIVPSAQSRFYDQDVGGAGGSRTWAQWQAAGRDTGGRAQHLVASNYDPDPFNGGAM